MPMVPKSFRLADYKARALSHYATDRGQDDGELLRDIVDDFLKGQEDYDPYDFIPPIQAPSPSNG